MERPTSCFRIRVQKPLDYKRGDHDKVCSVAVACRYHACSLYRLRVNDLCPSGMKCGNLLEVYAVAANLHITRIEDIFGYVRISCYELNLSAYDRLFELEQNPVAVLAYLVNECGSAVFVRAVEHALVVTGHRRSDLHGRLYGVIMLRNSRAGTFGRAVFAPEEVLRRFVGLDRTDITVCFIAVFNGVIYDGVVVYSCR